MRSRLVGMAVITAALAAAGCSATLVDPMGRGNALEEAQKNYTQLIRWGEIGRAADYVDPELREAWLSRGPRLESVRISDYETDSFDMADDEDSATVTVTYHAFSYVTALEKSIREEQHWYREGGLANVWRVRSGLPEQLDELEGRATR